MKSVTMFSRAIFAVLLLGLSASGYAGSVNKCIDADGSVIYTQRPCDEGSTAKQIKLKKHRPAPTKRQKPAQYLPGHKPSDADQSDSGKQSSTNSAKTSRSSTSGVSAARKRQRCKQYKALLKKRLAQGGVEHISVITGRTEIRNDARSRQLIQGTRDNVRYYCG